MKKTILGISMINLLYSSPFVIIDNFLEGDNYEKKIDKTTLSDEYIDYLLKDKFLKYGYYQYPVTILLSSKKEKKLSVINTKVAKKEADFSILLGKNRGDKWKEGDNKTPIGGYELKSYLTKQQLDKKYGLYAYVTNYPNLYDKYLKKDGHGIWIHGVPLENPDRKIDTKGCIALQNSDLAKFHSMINYKNAILLIVDNNPPTTNKSEIKIILKNLFEWRYAWKYNQLHKYLSFYDKTKFKKEARYGFQYFKNMKTEIFKRNQKKSIKFKNIKIIPYPNSQNKRIFKVEFNEVYKSGSHYFNGKKIIYLEIKNEKISIFLEN